MLHATSSAVSGSPFQNVTSSRSWKTQVVGVGVFQDCARPGPTLKSGCARSRDSHALASAVFSA